MRKSRKMATLIPALMIWLILAVLFWSWIFTFLTDTDPAHKITLFADVAVSRDKELAIELEKELPDGIRMVKVHRFSYAMFDSNNLRNADLFILKASDLEQYRDWLAPLPEQVAARAVLFDESGTPLGIPVFDPSDGTCAASSYLTYTVPGEDPELWCLAFGASSVHLPDGADSPSVMIADKLLSLE